MHSTQKPRIKINYLVYPKIIPRSSIQQKWVRKTGTKNGPALNMAAIKRGTEMGSSKWDPRCFKNCAPSYEKKSEA